VVGNLNLLGDHGIPASQEHLFRVALGVDNRSPLTRFKWN